MRIPLLIPTSCCLALLACTGSPPSQARTPPSDREATPQRRPLVTDLASVAEIDGQIVVELAVGHEQGVLNGDLFRVYGSDPSAPIKGMLQITDVIGPRQAMARQIGLLDRNQPLKVADEARLVRNLSLADDLQKLEESIETEREAAAQESEAKENAFTGLRRNYQERLGQFQQRQDTLIAQLEREHEEEMAAVRAESKRDHDRQAATHRAELAALRNTIAEEAATNLRQDRRAKDQEIQELKAENIRLNDRIATQVAELQTLTKRITQLHDTALEKKSQFEREIKAEQETREVLSQRVNELERRVAGRAVIPKVVLTGDPERDETILERLERVTAERDLAQQRVSDLEQDLLHQRRLLASTEEQLSDLREQVGSLGARVDDRAQLKERVDAMNAEARRLREHAQALELARLQAERTYYDLAARVLNLPDQEPATSDLQIRLRRQLQANDPNSTESTP